MDSGPAGLWGRVKMGELMGRRAAPPRVTRSAWREGGRCTFGNHEPVSHYLPILKSEHHHNQQSVLSQNLIYKPSEMAVALRISQWLYLAGWDSFGIFLKLCWVVPQNRNNIATTFENPILAIYRLSPSRQPHPSSLKLANQKPILFDEL